MKKIDVKAFSLSVGLSFGLFTMMLGWISYWGWGDKVVEIIGSAYIGYDSTFIGGIIGGLWGFVDLAIGAAIVAFLYNKLVK